jgi:hypothetical protein
VYNDRQGALYAGRYVRAAYARWDQAKPGERRQIIEIAKALLKTTA